jgi:oxygen-independent coproporphyrinogen-3 oxidase
MTKSKLGLYIHIPFCQKKCYYCDFYSLATNVDVIDKYAKEVANEIYLFSKNNPNYYISTIYLGGGTPSLLSLENLEIITNSIYSNFECNIDEFTIEVNPNSSQNLEHYKKFGIDRISLGVQSLDDNILKKIGRLHDKKMAINALDRAANLYDNVSGDLIVGIDENQDIISDVKQIQNFVKHISSYMLKVEDGTKLQKQICDNTVAVATEDSQVNQYEKLYAYCMENNFLRYETSNFAHLGYEGKHNLSYWDMSDYLGVGTSAHSFIGGKRFYNKMDINSYLLGEHTGYGLEIIEREYSYNATIEEYIMLALRTEKGIKISDFNEKFQKDFLLEYQEKIKKTAQYTIIQEDYFRIKPQYFLVQNAIILELL